jgi:hypothetical protein
MKNSEITAIFKTREHIATDSIILNGQPFATMPPNKSCKYLVVRALPTGDSSAQKPYVPDEMKPH